MKCNKKKFFDTPFALNEGYLFGRIVYPVGTRKPIFTIRGKQVMFNTDVTEMYQVEVKRRNKQLKHNINRFPEIFVFSRVPQKKMD